jgi:hypothetical protein
VYHFHLLAMTAVLCSRRRESSGSRRKREEAAAAKQAEETEQLMKELDRDIKRMLSDDLDAYDHNADKKDYLAGEEDTNRKVRCRAKMSELQM